MRWRPVIIGDALLLLLYVRWRSEYVWAVNHPDEICGSVPTFEDPCRAGLGLSAWHHAYYAAAVMAFLLGALHVGRTGFTRVRVGLVTGLVAAVASIFSFEENLPLFEITVHGPQLSTYAVGLLGVVSVFSILVAVLSALAGGVVARLAMREWRQTFPPKARDGATSP